MSYKQTELKDALVMLIACREVLIQQFDFLFIYPSNLWADSPFLFVLIT